MESRDWEELDLAEECIEIFKWREDIMINGDAREFIDGLHYGDERFFCYKGYKYFIQGYYIDGKPLLEMYAIESEDNNF